MNNFSILANLPLDLDKLANQLDKVDDNAYIFVNRDTFKKLKIYADIHACPITDKNGDPLILLQEKVTEYKGHRIYINNDLDYGEVELR